MIPGIRTKLAKRSFSVAVWPSGTLYLKLFAHSLIKQLLNVLFKLTILIWLLTFVLHMFFTNVRGEKNTPKCNKEYLSNHWTDLHHITTIRRELSLSFSQFKQFLKNVYNYVYFKKIQKNTILIEKSNFRLRKTSVSYQPCDIFIRLRDRERNHVLLNLSHLNRCGIFKMAALNRKWIRKNDYFRVHAY